MYIHDVIGEHQWCLQLDKCWARDGAAVHRLGVSLTNCHVFTGVRGPEGGEQISGGRAVPPVPHLWPHPGDCARQREGDFGHDLCGLHAADQPRR